MGKGFVWNGVSSSYIPILFLDSTTAPTTTIKNTWCQATISGTPSATCLGTPDPDYEITGPQVFRFEYYYLLTNGNLSVTPASGIQDVAAVVVDIAMIDLAIIDRELANQVFILAEKCRRVGTARVPHQ